MPHRDPYDYYDGQLSNTFNYSEYDPDDRSDPLWVRCCYGITFLLVVLIIVAVSSLAL